MPFNCSFVGGYLCFLKTFLKVCTGLKAVKCHSQITLLLCSFYIEMLFNQICHLQDLTSHFQNWFSFLRRRGKRFMSMFNPFFLGKLKMTMKVHMLRHIPMCVRNFGPLWVFLCFAYESSNGFLKTMVHGTRYIADQACILLELMGCEDDKFSTAWVICLRPKGRTKFH